MVDKSFEKSSFKINLVLYSNNEPYNTTKKLLINSIKDFTKYNICIYDYNLEKIKNCNWFNKISSLPTINKGYKRDGYYNSWKAFIVHEVYNKMDKNDILYYVDCSRYFKTGFTENIDKLVEIVNKKDIIAGSVGKDILNKSFNCCNNINIWNKIIPNNNNYIFLNKMHVLNSWFILKKSNTCTKFINDWIYYTIYTDKDIKLPLVTYHHTVDQSIFNILVYKYNLTVFYHDKILHNDNKDRNKVLNIINNNYNKYEKYFINLI